MQPDITLTKVASERLGGILDQQNQRDTHALRVFVKGGGCGGMQYGMTFDDDIQETDWILDQQDLKVIVDVASYNYVQGSSIDYVDNLMGGGFQIENPNATSTCGCGSSFRSDNGATGGGCGNS